MFSRRKNKTSGSLVAVSQAPSIIVSDLNISGDLVSQGSIEIGGRVNGNVKCNNVVIRKESKVSGDIVADHLVIKGVVVGTITADHVVIDETGVFEGQINYKDITTRPGACINGIMKKMNKSAIIIDNDSEDINSIELPFHSNASNKSKGNEAANNNANKSDEEYIPSISTLIDGKDKSDVVEKSEEKSKVAVDGKDDANDKSSKLSSGSSLGLNGIKPSKKSSILNDESFDFLPPSDRKSKKHKTSKGVY